MKVGTLRFSIGDPSSLSGNVKALGDLITAKGKTLISLKHLEVGALGTADPDWSRG